MFSASFKICLNQHKSLSTELVSYDSSPVNVDDAHNLLAAYTKLLCLNFKNTSETIVSIHSLFVYQLMDFMTNMLPLLHIMCQSVHKTFI